MTTILIGTDPVQEKFVVHQALLCSKSQYFTKALTGSFEESKTGIVRFEDVSPVLFRIVVNWLYDGKIVYTVSDDGSSINHDFADLTAVTEICDEGLNADDPLTWPYQVILKLYVLADRLDIRELRNSIIDTLTAAYRRPKNGPSVEDYKFIDSNTTSESPLRRLTVDFLAYKGKRVPEDSEIWRALPHDIVVEVLMRVGGRVPIRLCNSCYQRGLSRNKVVLDDDHLCKNEDKMPFEADMCIYHEHADGEEKRLCQTTRTKDVNK